MSWYQTLTRNQRLVLISLASALVVVIALLSWSVWSTLRAEAQAPPTPDGAATSGAAPTRTTDAASSTATPTPDPSPSPTVPPQPSVTPTYDVFRAGVVAANVADARQSRTRWGTPLTLVDRVGMARALYAHYETRPPLVLRAQDALGVLNLWACGSDEDCAVRLDVVSQARKTAAFYVPEQAELYLRRDWVGPVSTLERHLAYGFARALPDQFGDIRALMAEATSLDLQLALAAVVEGEALVSVWLLNDAMPSDPSAMSARARELRTEILAAVCPQWQHADPWTEELSCLTFDLGTRFVTSRYLEGGVEAMDEIILRPPRSTEQMLHPERYASADEPTAVTPLEPALGPDWQLGTADTLGEALMSRVFAAWDQEATPDAGDAVVTEAALDWGGDLLQIWRTADGEWVAGWQIYLDDIPAAIRLHEQFTDLMPQPLSGGRVFDTVPPEALRGGRWWATEEGSVYLHRRRNRVALVWGHDLDAVERVGIEVLR